MPGKRHGCLTFIPAPHARSPGRSAGCSQAARPLTKGAAQPVGFGRPSGIRLCAILPASVAQHWLVLDPWPYRIKGA